MEGSSKNPLEEFFNPGNEIKKKSNTLILGLNSADIRDRIVFEYMLASKNNYGPEMRFQAEAPHSVVPTNKASVSFPYSESKVVNVEMDRRYQERLKQ